MEMTTLLDLVQGMRRVLRQVGTTKDNPVLEEAQIHFSEVRVAEQECQEPQEEDHPDHPAHPEVAEELDQVPAQERDQAPDQEPNQD